MVMLLIGRQATAIRQTQCVFASGLSVTSICLRVPIIAVHNSFPQVEA